MRRLDLRHSVGGRWATRHVHCRQRTSDNPRPTVTSENFRTLKQLVNFPDRIKPCSYFVILDCRLESNIRAILIAADAALCASTALRNMRPDQRCNTDRARHPMRMHRMTGTSFSRVVRIAWLLTRLVRRDAVDFNAYRERFAASPRTFFRDIAALRDAGICLETNGSGYRMLCFRSEREAA